MENLTIANQSNATVTRGSGVSDVLNLHGVFEFECFDKDGNLKWKDIGYNTVSNQGKNGMMDTYLGLSPALASAWYMSLVTAGTATTSSTYATPIVTEITSSIVATRPTVAWSAASAGSKAATTTAFSIIGSATITGNMLVTATSNGSVIANTAGTGGIFFSGAAFSGGSKAVTSGDTLNVTYSLSI
jgi:hypothetical protein